MAHRYGWTFSYIYSLEFTEFLEAIKILNVGIESDFKDQMTVAAFGSWQIVEAVQGMLGGNKKNAMSFQKYAKGLGLLDSKGPTEEDNAFKKRQREIEKQKALKTAQEILRIDRQG